MSFTLVDLGAGLTRVRCESCEQTAHAVGEERAIDAVKAEHHCGGEHWHIDAGQPATPGIAGPGG